MQAPTRTLRERIADTRGIRSPLSPREIDRRNTVLRAATILMADFPSNSFTLSQFAIAIEASTATIRRYFIDMDGVLAEILSRHLLALAAALGKIAPGAPDEPAALRAAYLAHTRTPMGGLTQEHVLFTRDRFSLPPDDRNRLEAIHLSLGEQLGGLSPQDVLSLLDSPVLDAGEIEDLIAARTRRAAENIRLAASAAAHLVPPAPAAAHIVPPAPAAAHLVPPAPAAARTVHPVPAPPRMVHPAPPETAPGRQPPAADTWMPSPSLYDRYIADRQRADGYFEDPQHAAAQARAGP